MAKKSYTYLRHPKTTQERKANLDKYDTKIRGKRRNLPTSYDDIFVHYEKSWKSSGRKKQYRESKEGYKWRFFHYVWGESNKRGTYHHLWKKVFESGCYYKHTGRGLKWFGPDFLNED